MPTTEELELDQLEPTPWQSFRAKLSGYEALSPQTIIRGNKIEYKGSFFIRTAGASGILLLLLTAVLLMFSSGPGTTVKDGPYVRYHFDNHWHGWQSIEHLIIFGDSWSTTGFDPAGARPSTENPLGNPEYPGLTSSNIANWVDYLIYDYNSSLILTANFAIGGARVYDPEGQDERVMQKQITEHFAMVHDTTNNSVLYDWKSSSSLFVLWIGINDIHTHFDDKTPLEPIYPIYADLVDQLYKKGARNFMFIDVPPLEHSPIADKTGHHETWRELVTQYNAQVEELAWNITSTYSDVTTFFFSSYHLLNDVIDYPCVLPESCGLKVVKGDCGPYTFSTVFGNDSSPDCPAAVNEYLWLNPLHITTVTHKVIGKAIHDALQVR